MPTEPVEAAQAGPSTSQKITFASIIVIAGVLGSRLLGLVRAQVLSIAFGSADAGALRAAYDLPDLMFYLVAGGALRSGFVPIFTRLMHGSQDEPADPQRAWWLFSVLATTVFTVSVALIVVAEIFAGPLTAPMTGRFAEQGYSPEATQLTIYLTRVLLPGQIFVLLGGLLSGTLDSLKQFKVSALVPNVYNLAIIAAMLLFGQRYGVQSAAWGSVCGAFIGHFVWQWWSLARHGKAYGFRFRPSLQVRDPDVLRVIKIAAPIILGLCVAEINLKVTGWVMAWFGESARNWLDNASRIARLPDGIFGAGLGIALFPYLSEMAAAGKLDEFRKQAERILRLGLVCSIPSAALLIATPYPFVDLLFGHGRFGPEDVRQTAIMLPLFALSVVPITLQVVITRAFYAREDSVTPVKVGVVAVGFGIVTNLLLGKLLGPVGPPLAMALTSWANMVGLILLYRRTLGFADLRGMFRTAVKALGAAAIAGLAAAGAVAVAPASSLLQSLLSFAVWAVVYGLVVKAMGVDEINEVVGMLKRRLRKG